MIIWNQKKISIGTGFSKFGLNFQKAKRKNFNFYKVSHHKFRTCPIHRRTLYTKIDFHSHLNAKSIYFPNNIHWK